MSSPMNGFGHEDQGGQSPATWLTRVLAHLGIYAFMRVVRALTRGRGHRLPTLPLLPPPSLPKPPSVRQRLLETLERADRHLQELCTLLRQHAPQAQTSAPSPEAPVKTPPTP